MTVNTTWVNPTGATLDISAGNLVGEVNWDALVSNTYRLGGTDGNSKTGPLQIGASTTYSNALNTTGLTIQQVAADDEAVSLKSSTDIAHGMTGLTETDTYGLQRKILGTTGGLLIWGFTEATTGLQLLSSHTTEDTTKSTTGTGSIGLQGRLKSGTNDGAMGANANILTVGNHSTTRFILDADGDSHQDVGTAWTNFAEHDDVGLLWLLSAHVTRADDPLRRVFTDWIARSRAPLEAARIVTFNADGHHFINWSRTHMLQIGAILQLHERLRALEALERK